MRLRAAIPRRGRSGSTAEHGHQLYEGNCSFTVKHSLIPPAACVANSRQEQGVVSVPTLVALT